MRYSLLWHFTQRRLVICYRRFGTIYLSHLLGLLGPWRLDSIGCPETSVRTTILRFVKSHQNSEDPEAWRVCGRGLDLSTSFSTVVQRRALMNTLMKLRVPQEGTSWSCEWLSTMISVINSTISGDCRIETVICVEKSWKATSHNCASWRH